MADKKLFELTLGTPTDTDLIAYGKTGSSYKNISIANFRTIMQGDLGTYKTVTSEMGSWNMATTASKLVNVYLPLQQGQIFATPIMPDKIRKIDILVRNDGATPVVYDFLSSHDGTALTMPQVSVMYSTFIFPATTVWIYRRNGGYFTKDSAFIKTTNPDTTPYNRGWVTVTYVD